MRIAIGLLLLAPSIPDASGQVFVHPRRPSQSNVRYFDFRWRYVDILIGSQAPDEPRWERGPRLHRAIFAPPVPGSDWSWPVLDGAPLSRRAPDAPGIGTRPDSSPEETGEGDAAEGEGEAEASEEAGEGDAPAPWSGGVRLWFYEREREVAERAAASIARSYDYLVDAFGHVPRRTFPYFLYSSYLEFLQTDLFPIQEGVLGVTSPRSLEVALPYFGDHRQFEHVSTHELAHEFTIQKIRDVKKASGVSGEPLTKLPLWFIEGLAEYYARRGLDPESRLLDPEAQMLVRDLVVNPDADEGYVFGSFFEERLGSSLWTYKVGQARCAFLEETYGEGTLQRVLDETPRLVGAVGDQAAVGSFPQLLSAVTGDSASALSAKFSRWIKRRTFGEYLDTEQGPADLRPLLGTEDGVQTLAASPDGHLLMYRSIEENTGRRLLWLLDHRAPKEAVKVAADGVPGVETLHPVAGRTFALRDDALVFVALAEGSDRLYWQPIRHRAWRKRCDGEAEAKRKKKDEDGDASRWCGWEVRLSLGERRGYEIGDHGILLAEAPALSPDGRRVAFVGVDLEGRKDLWVLGPLGERRVRLRRLTDDVHAERGVAWGPDGVVFTSDATGHGRYNLFRIDPDGGGEPERLTREARDHFDPAVLSDGRVLFAAWDDVGANVHEVQDDGGVIRHTHVPTGFFDLSAGPGRGIWALYHHSGRRWPVRLGRDGFLERTTEAAPPDEEPARPPPRRSLVGDEPYEVLSLESWELGNLFGILAAGPGGVAGQIIATAHDRLRQHGMILTVFAYGSLDRTDATLFYVDQSDRTMWGAGIFHDVRYRFDETFDDEDLRVLSLERFAGGAGLLRFPLNRFIFLQTELSVGYLDYYLTDASEDFLDDPERTGALEPLADDWAKANDGGRFHVEPSMSLGFSTIRYHRATGPIRGASFLLEQSFGIQPFDERVYAHLRADGEGYLPIMGAANIAVRGGAGATVGDERARQFFLSSFDTLRGVPFGDTDFLLGRSFFFTTAELQLPLVTFSRMPLIDLEGVAGVDFGAAGDGRRDLWRRRVLDFALGLNFGLGPLIFRLHFAKPIDVNAVAVPNDGDWTTNFSLNWRYR
ncbi:MAG: tolB protein precursor protein [Myxococcota bacterium]